jgi:preprotein translocase subunit YajC
MNLINSLALAGDTAAAHQDPQAQMIQMVIMFAVLGVMFYLIILRPQKKEQKQQEEMRSAVKKGDKVVTIGGAHGVVTAVDTTNGIVTVQVDKNCKIDFNKGAISTVITKEEAREAEKTGK